MALDRQKATQFRNACAAFDITNSNAITSLSSVLDQLATELAKSEVLRQRIGKVEPSIWPDLQKLWHTITETQLSPRRSSWDGDEESLRRFSVHLCKFTRNSVAAVPENQAQAYQVEPNIRRLLHHYTSWLLYQDAETFKVARALVQALSNLVTANETLLSKVWETHLNLPEEQVSRRLLGSPDPNTLLSVLILIVNCIHKSDSRLTLLCTSTIGARICISLLDRMVTLYDAAEGSYGAKAFDTGYGIFSRIFAGGYAPDLYKKLSVSDEIIAPHQTTFLKLLDSYLQSADGTFLHVKLCPMLSEAFFGLSGYAQQAIRRALGPKASSGQSPRGLNIEVASSADSEPPHELDLLLPKVCEALVLVTQCIITITLDEEEGDDGEDDADASMWVDSEGNELRSQFNEARSGAGEGLAESLLELLRLLDLFLPRIHFGKAVQTSPNDQYHGAAADPTGFSYLKRDLVRLLAILCQGTRAVQDRVRNCGGIPVVMNLCVVDERNPYLREHAILALHNLLENNEENQAIVDSIKPLS